MAEESDTDNDLTIRIVTVSERHKTARTVAICLTIGFGIAVVCTTIVRLVDKPPWLELLLAIIGLAAAPSGVLALLIRAIRRYTKRTAPLLAEAQRRDDSARSSSNLRPDGTDKPIA